MATEYLRGSVDGRVALIEFDPVHSRSVVLWGGDGRPDGPHGFRYTVTNATRDQLHFSFRGSVLVVDSRTNRMAGRIEDKLSGAGRPSPNTPSPVEVIPPRIEQRSTGSARPILSGPGRGVGGMNDHHATWHFTVHAAPNTCLSAFTQALSEKTHLSSFGSQWRVRGGGGRALVALYQGRSDAMQLLTAFSRIASGEQSSAIDSELRFEIEGEHDGLTECTMWLATFAKGGPLGLFTADARFIRAAMSRVVDQLRTLDPALGVTLN